MNHTWQSLTDYVLANGTVEEPRGRKTIALEHVTYEMDPHQHFDARPTRNLSLNYVFREFLWFCRADRFDIRMADYAPIWKTCINNGTINSNYGWYLFRGGFNSPFVYGLMHLVRDQQSRRCWIPIFQTYHQGEELHEDYPCTTGMGFSIRDGALQMNVHMRSQDLWWGASNDEPVCYLIQLMAAAFLNSLGIDIGVGTIVHHIDNLHLYERHWEKAAAGVHDLAVRDDVAAVTKLCDLGFSGADLEYLLGHNCFFPMSPLLSIVTDIPGAYGRFDEVLY